MKKVAVLIAVLMIAAAVLTAGSGQAKAAIIGKKVLYSAKGVVLKGYLAYDNRSRKKRPGILVVHEWWGLNAYAKKRARMLAGLGYTALAVDMYGNGKVTMHPADAGRFSGEIMKVTVYPGALHSFTNPDSTRLGKKFKLPMAYDKDADSRSWQDMRTFFAAVFKK